MIFGSRPYGSIVTDGLVLNLDATNINSYPGSGTTWTDTSGYNNSGSLINGPTFLQERGRGSIVFDGIDDYTTTSNTFNNTAATWEVWFNPSTISRAGAYARRILHKSNAIGNNEINILHSDGNISWYGYSTSYIWNLSTGSISTNKWFNVAGTYNGSVASLYLNGAFVTSSLQSSYPGDATFPLYIGRVGFSNVAIYQGSISNVRIYNRALNATEVAQNYNALKSRFT